MLEEAFGFILSFAGVSFLAWLGLAAMGMGAVRGIEMGVDMTSRRPGESAQGTGWWRRLNPTEESPADRSHDTGTGCQGQEPTVGIRDDVPVWTLGGYQAVR